MDSGPVLGVKRYVIPPELLEIFKQEMRVIPQWPPAPGYWPVDIRVLVEHGLLEKLVKNKQFNEQFQIVIMPR
jgi:hypothetical protein